MSSRSAESGGFSDFKVLPEQRGVGPRVQKPREPSVQSRPSEQRREAKPFQPNPAERQAAERLGKPPPEKEGEVVETLDPEVLEMIHEAAMGDPEKEAHLLESAKKHRTLRDFFKHGPGTLTRSFPAIDLSAVFRRDKEDIEEDNSR